MKEQCQGAEPRSPRCHPTDHTPLILLRLRNARRFTSRCFVIFFIIACADSEILLFCINRRLRALICICDFRYLAPWPLYSMNWSVRPDKRFRLALGSFVEEYNNKVCKNFVFHKELILKNVSYIMLF